MRKRILSSCGLKYEHGLLGNETLEEYKGANEKDARLRMGGKCISGNMK